MATSRGVVVEDVDDDVDARVPPNEPRASASYTLSTSSSAVFGAATTTAPKGAIFMGQFKPFESISRPAAAASKRLTPMPWQPMEIGASLLLDERAWALSGTL